MKEKKKLILDAFDNKAVNRVPVGFWWHFADEYNPGGGAAPIRCNDAVPRPRHDDTLCRLVPRAT